ncbi:MAG: hypothetical protein CMN30_20435 [Sandaracinus sp.]|nr:hypothetical protein [Sandaracinus sp.]
MVSVDIGSTLGPYRLVAELGQGGMARLFLGLRPMPDGTQREAAIKVIRPEHLQDRAFVEMFLDEGRIASHVNHPNVVRIHEVSEAGGTYFMAMEFLHAVTLATFLKELYRMSRRPSPEVATAILIRVADGLHAAHETCDEAGRLLDIVHRDVSPSNVLASCGGAVRLIDFGIAKAQGRLHKTSFGRTKGKLRYMAPEQMRRNPVDRRADIWALGVVLWETLATRRLYGSSGDLDVVRAALDGGIQPPGAYADVPFAVDRVVMRCLAVDPDQRPATAGELARLLREASPEAAAITDAELGSLVWAVCGHVLDQRSRELPIELPTRKSLAHLDPPPNEALARMSEFLDESDDATVVGGLTDEDRASMASKAPASPPKLASSAFDPGRASPDPLNGGATIPTGLQAPPMVPPPSTSGEVPRADVLASVESPSWSGEHPRPPIPAPQRRPMPLALWVLLAVLGAVATGVLTYIAIRSL